MSRETEQKVKKAINKNYTKIIYKLDPGPVIDHLRESGILTVAGHDMYSEELKNMLKVGKTKAAVNERLIEILFTREKWWMPLIKAIRKCDPASGIADIIAGSLPKSERLKLERTRSWSGKERSSCKSSRHKETVDSRSEASTDGYDSDSDLSSSCNSTRRKLEPDHPNDAWNFNPQRNSKEESRHHSSGRHFEDFTQARKNLGEQAPGVTNQSEGSHMSHNGLFQHSGQPHVPMQTSYSYAGERPLPPEAPGFSRSSSAPAGPAHGQYPQNGQQSSAGTARGTSHLGQYPQDGQQPSAEYSSQSQNGVSIGTNGSGTGTFQLHQHISANQGCDGVYVQKKEMTPSLLISQHIASQDQQPTEDVSSDVKTAEREVTYTMDMPVGSVPIGVLNIFNKLDFNSDRDWREFAGKLTEKFVLDDEHRIESKSESKTKQVIDHFRMVEGEKAKFGKMISALKEIQRRDLLNEIWKITGLRLSDEEEVEEEEIEQTPLGNSRNTKKKTDKSKVDLEFGNPVLTPGEGAKMSGACSDKTEKVASLSESAIVDNSESPNVDVSRDSNKNDSKEADRECKRVQDTDARNSDRPVDDRILMSQLDEERKLDEAIRVESQKQQVTSESSPQRDVPGNHSNHLNISSGSDMSDENNLREGDTIIANQKENLKKPEKTSKIMNISQHGQPVAGAIDMKQTQRTDDDKTKIYYPPGDTGEFGPKIDLPRDSKPVNTGTTIPGGPTLSTQHPGYYPQIRVPVQSPYQQGPYMMTSAQHNSFPRIAHPAMNYAQLNQGVCFIMPHQGFPPGQIPGTVPQQQPQQMSGNIPRLSLIDAQVSACTQDMTTPKEVYSISQPSGNGSKATVWQSPQETSGRRFNSPSLGNIQPELPPHQDLMENSNGSLYLSASLGSSVLEGPTAADYRPVQSPAHVLLMSLSSVPPSVHNIQAQYALQQKINSQNTVEYQLVSSKPCEEDEDIPIDEEEDEDSDEEEEEDEDDTEEEEGESEEDTCPKQIDDELQNNPVDETMVKQIIEETQDGIGCKSCTDPAKEDGSPDKTMVKDTMSARISEGEKTSETTVSEIGREATNGDKSANIALSEGGPQARPSEASASPSDPGGETVAVPSGGRATNSVRNVFKTAVKLYECVSVGTNVNMFQKWHST